jgi:hypothetical protein
MHRTYHLGSNVLGYSLLVSENLGFVPRKSASKMKGTKSGPYLFAKGERGEFPQSRGEQSCRASATNRSQPAFLTPKLNNCGPAKKHAG